MVRLLQGKIPSYDLATVIDPPYVMAKTAGGKGYEGLVVDVLDKLAKSAKFKYELTVINGTYGHQEPDSTWSGLIGSVVTLPADMAVGAIAQTHSRESVMEFTHWFHSSSVQLLMLRPSPEEGPGAGLLLVPFSTAAWILVILAFLLVSAGFFLIGRFSPREWIRVAPENDVRRARYSFGLRNSFLFTVSTMMWQGYREAPKSLSGRVLAVAWWMFVSMIIIAYTSNLTALVTSRPHVQPALSFRNYEDILRDRSLDIGMIQNGDADLELKNSDVNLEKQLHEYVSRNHNWVGNLTFGLRRLRDSRGKFALLLPSYKARYLASHNCDLITFGHGLGMIKYAFGFPAGNSLEVLKRRLNSAILALRGTDEMDTLSHEWDRKGGNCPDPDGSGLPVRRETVGLTFMELGPRDLAVPFLLLFLCGLLAGGIAALEILNEKGYFNFSMSDSGCSRHGELVDAV
ncbi:glutamate receptor 2-like [Babylonia areolata]|uniref:glutamate receptor 2-like n=1 Tax=Babylonia areolata TaxID=304850 RepID=UPI003FD36232